MNSGKFKTATFIPPSPEHCEVMLRDMNVERQVGDRDNQIPMGTRDRFNT
jgi:hypothetical protein